MEARFTLGMSDHSWLFKCFVFFNTLIAQLVKNPPVMQETLVQFLGREDPLEKGKATHPSILAWRIPWTVQSMGSQRVRHNRATFRVSSSPLDKRGYLPPNMSFATALLMGTASFNMRFCLKATALS